MGKESIGGGRCRGMGILKHCQVYDSSNPMDWSVGNEKVNCSSYLKLKFPETILNLSIYPVICACKYAYMALGISQCLAYDVCVEI